MAIAQSALELSPSRSRGWDATWILWIAIIAVLLFLVVSPFVYLVLTSFQAEKTGAFTGAYAVNPATGELIPVWTADYVLMEYGTGAIMAVPAHDQREYSRSISR